MQFKSQVMQRYFLFLSTIFFSMLLLSSCENEPVEPEQNVYPEVDQRLWHLFEAFEQEASDRGIEVDLEAVGISGDISSIPEDHVAGQCSYSSAAPGVVTVDEEFWNNSSGLFQEFIVFHELGHCYLGRGHREDVDENGFCISLMRSGLEDCQDNYTSQTREAFLDELFFPEDF